jgi:hypothetical protein
MLEILVIADALTRLVLESIISNTFLLNQSTFPI